jgi:hypothetical protein
MFTRIGIASGLAAALAFFLLADCGLAQVVVRQSTSSTQVPGSKGPMVSAAEFGEIKALHKSIQDLPACDSAELFDKKKDETLAELDKKIKGLEGKRVCGRWARKFFETEFKAVFDEAAERQKFPAEAKPAEAATIKAFWDEIGFLHEGYVTIEKAKESDSWMRGLLNKRCARAFGLVKGVPFGRRLEVLALDRGKYTEKLVKMLDARVLYMKSSKASGVIGKLKEAPGGMKVSRPKDGAREWADLASRKDAEIYEDDLFDVTALDQVRLVLRDERTIMLEGGAILTGWELDPKVSKDLEAKIAQLVKDLGSDDFNVREDASKSLVEIGAPAVASLQTALKSDDAEVRYRAEAALKLIPAARGLSGNIPTGFDADQWEALPDDIKEYWDEIRDDWEALPDEQRERLVAQWPNYFSNALPQWDTLPQEYKARLWQSWKQMVGMADRMHIR